MPYSNDNDLFMEFSEEELARLTGDPTGEIVNAERINHARDHADSLIDSYLYDRYSVPFTAPVPQIIHKLSNDLTVVNLYDFAYKNSSVPNTIVWRKINAVKLLKEIRAGNVSIVGADHGTSAPPPIVTNRSDKQRRFDEDTLDRFWGGE